jgi:hypothetical protein
MPRQNPTHHWQLCDAQINAAYQWLCQQRKHFPANADIWDFRVTWASRKANLVAQISTANINSRLYNGLP